MEHINTYEEDLQEVTLQLKNLQERKAQLEQSITIRDASKCIGDILDKLYISKFDVQKYVIFTKIEKVGTDFNYHGFRILDGIDFNISIYSELFVSAEDFAEKYDFVEIGPKSFLHNVILAFRTLIYKVNETSTND